MWLAIVSGRSFVSACASGVVRVCNPVRCLSVIRDYPLFTIQSELPLIVQVLYKLWPDLRKRSLYSHK